MHVERIEIEGFRSFSSKQVLDLHSLPAGLYFVAGDNKAEPRLGANGSGKSSLFEVAHWVLTGATSRGLRATNLRPWGSKKVSTVGALVLDGVRVERSWSPNHLMVDGAEVDQAQLEQALRLPQDIILNSFYFSQFQPFFLDLKPAQRMSLYSQVLQLNVWEEKSKQAKRMADSFDEDIQAALRAEAAARSRLETLQEQDYEAQQAEWERERKAQVKACTKELREFDRAASDTDNRVAELLSKQSRVYRELEVAQTSPAKADKAVGASVKKLQGLRSAAAAELRMLRAAQETLAEATVDGTSCPKCGSALNKKTFAAHRKHLQLEVDQAADSEKDLRAQVMTAAEKVEELEAVQLEAEKKVRRLEREGDAIEAELQQLEKRLATHDEQRQRLQDRLDMAKGKPSPFAKLLKKTKAQMLDAEQEAKDAHERAAAAQRDQALFEFWVKGYKDVRFQVLQESLLQLNAEVNECLHDMGLVGWKMEFSVERETKAGNIARGFLCLVTSPGSTEAVPWEAWSGGETQRLRIVGQMGVSNMISSRLGINLDVEFWDEPSNWLNEGGIKDALELLRERAVRYERRIFIADHRSLDFDFDGVVTVTKTKDGGSQLRPSWLP